MPTWCLLTEMCNFVLVLMPVHLLALSNASRLSLSFFALLDSAFFPPYPLVTVSAFLSLRLLPSLSVSLTLSLMRLCASEVYMGKIADRLSYSRLGAWQTFSILASVCILILLLVVVENMLCQLVLSKNKPTSTSEFGNSSVSSYLSTFTFWDLPDID